MNKEIRHSFLIKASPETISNALMQEAQIQKWWTKDARVQNGKAVLGFASNWVVELEMEPVTPQKLVVWKCTKSNMLDTDAWKGTTITFTLKPETQGTRLDFAQTGYRESPCYVVCDKGWAFFVGTSFKQYIETGKGIPYPEILDTRNA